jgi:hypothetical protein
MGTGPRRQPPACFDFRKKKVDEETQAKAIDAAKTVVKQVPDEVKDKAKEMLISPEAAEMRQKALQAAQALMQSQNATDAPKTTCESNPASPAIPVVNAAAASGRTAAETAPALESG